MCCVLCAIAAGVYELGLSHHLISISLCAARVCSCACVCSLLIRATTSPSARACGGAGALFLDISEDWQMLLDEEDIHPTPIQYSTCDSNVSLSVLCRVSSCCKGGSMPNLDQSNDGPSDDDDGEDENSQFGVKREALEDADLRVTGAEVRALD